MYSKFGSEKKCHPPNLRQASLLIGTLVAIRWYSEGRPGTYYASMSLNETVYTDLMWNI